MDFVYYAYDWVIDSQEIQNVLHMISKATELKFELKDSGFEFGLETVEGYAIRRFVVRVPNYSDLDLFIRSIKLSKSIDDWFEVSNYYYNNIDKIIRYEFSSLQNSDIGNWIGHFTLIDQRNKSLRKKLTQQVPLYFSCNWLIFSPQKRGWLGKFIWPLDPTYTIRTTGTQKREDGCYIFHMVIRVFSVEELSRLIGFYGKMLNCLQWDPAIEQDFFGATPITAISGKIALPGLYDEAEDLEIILDRLAEVNSGIIYSNK
jgi:hypothetical protein